MLCFSSRPKRQLEHHHHHHHMLITKRDSNPWPVSNSSVDLKRRTAFQQTKTNSPNLYLFLFFIYNSNKIYQIYTCTCLYSYAWRPYGIIDFWSNWNFFSDKGHAYQVTQSWLVFVTLVTLTHTVTLITRLKIILLTHGAESARSRKFLCLGFQVVYRFSAKSKASFYFVN